MKLKELIPKLSNDTDSYQNIFNSIEEKKRLFEPSIMTEEQIEEQNIIQSHQLNLEKDNF